MFSDDDVHSDDMLTYAKSYPVNEIIYIEFINLILWFYPFIRFV